jgi:hypothetical protein
MEQGIARLFRRPNAAVVAVRSAVRKAFEFEDDPAAKEYGGQFLQLAVALQSLEVAQRDGFSVELPLRTLEGKK